eukprot:880342-Rhodomonas_salina.2
MPVLSLFRNSMMFRTWKQDQVRLSVSVNDEALMHTDESHSIASANGIGDRRLSTDLIRRRRQRRAGGRSGLAR